jgi:type II secretory pathway pseudopilin PulG
MKNIIKRKNIILGFTLAEILVSVAILGLVGTGVISLYSFMANTSKKGGEDLSNVGIAERATLRIVNDLKYANSIQSHIINTREKNIVFTNNENQVIEYYFEDNKLYRENRSNSEKELLYNDIVDIYFTRHIKYSILIEMSVGDKKNPFHLITSVFLRNIK